MTPALTPELAIAYVRELSADVRAVVVLGADGARLAGPEALEAPARAFLEAASEQLDAAARVPGGVVLAARTATHAVVVSAGPLGLFAPSALDARTAVDALAGPVGAPRLAAAQPPEASAALQQAAQAVVLATHGAM